MEMHNVPLRGIKVDPLAHELATSEGTKPYLDCLIKAYRNKQQRCWTRRRAPSCTRLAAGKALHMESVFCTQVGIRGFRG
jgi:hypothetical protein